MPSASRFPPHKLRQAIDRAFDNFGPILKFILLNRLKQDYDISFEERVAAVPTLLDLERVLKCIFDDGSTEIIMGWIFDELEIADERKRASK